MYVWKHGKEPKHENEPTAKLVQQPIGVRDKEGAESQCSKPGLPLPIGSVLIYT